MTSRHLAAIQKSTIVRSFQVAGAGRTIRRSPLGRDPLVHRPTHPRPPRPAGHRRAPVPGAGRRPRGRRRGLGRGRPDGARGQSDPPAVYLVHGWGGWRWQLDPFVGPLVDAGFRVVAFDAPSHGGSGPGPRGRAGATSSSSPTPWPRWWRHTDRPAPWSPTPLVDGDRLRPQPGPAGRPPGVRLPHGRPALHRVAARLGFGERIRTRLVARVERRIGTPMSAFDVPAMAHRVATPPLLLVHDRLDAETGWADSAAIASPGRTPAWSPPPASATAGSSAPRPWSPRSPGSWPGAGGNHRPQPIRPRPLPVRARRSSADERLARWKTVQAATTAARGGQDEGSNWRRWPSKPRGGRRRGRRCRGRARAGRRRAGTSRSPGR